MDVVKYLEQRGWEHQVMDMYVNGTLMPKLPDEAVQFPLDQLNSDTNPRTVADFARATFGEYEGPVEFYIWTWEDGQAWEYLTVAGQVFERPRTAGGTTANRTKTILAVVGGLTLAGGALFVLSRGMK